MAYLKYYQDEKVEFKEAFNKDMISQETEIVFKKLKKHFKINHCRLEWTSGRNHPKAFIGLNSSFYSRLRMNYDWNNFGVLCHELAHIKLYNDKQICGHNKKHWNIMKRMIAYCQKKNWFKEELDRRTSIKIKPEPSKAEIKAKGLIQMQEKIIRYEKKIPFYQRKLSKAKRSYSLRQRHLDNLNKQLSIVDGVQNDTNYA
jgi:predicted SprT family Zn-dependent metalloprotease